MGVRGICMGKEGSGEERRGSEEGVKVKVGVCRGREQRKGRERGRGCVKKPEVGDGRKSRRNE